MHSLDNLRWLVSVRVIHRFILSFDCILVTITYIFRFQQFCYNLGMRSSSCKARTSASTSLKEATFMFSDARLNWTSIFNFFFQFVERINIFSCGGFLDLARYFSLSKTTHNSFLVSQSRPGSLTEFVFDWKKNKLINFEKGKGNGRSLK